MSKRQRDVNVTDHTIMCLFKGLYALSTTETLSTLARALGVAPAAVLDCPDRAGGRGEERCLPMGLRDDGDPFLLRTFVGAFFLVCCLLHGHPSYRWAVQDAGEPAGISRCRRKVMRNRKKHRSFKRKRRKHTSSRGVSEGLRTPPLVRTDEAVNREIEFVASLFVNQTTGPDGESEWDPEEDEEWVAYFEQRIQELEALQEAMQALPDEEIHRSLIRRGLEGERQQRVEQVIATIRRMCTEELESLPLALDAQKLRIALRDEVRTLCSRGLHRSRGLSSSLHQHAGKTCPATMNRSSIE